MGGALPKPITSKLIERCGNKHINGAVVSINGFRNNMEDAHIMQLQDDRMLFGVFDGHCNDRCSAFIADVIGSEVAKLALPASDAALQKMCLDMDAAYLKDYMEGGSTGTFCILEPGQAGSDSYQLTICNVGDSRIIVMRNGELVFVTEDHKPTDPEERDRIERCGGTVRMGRVDGDLALSRAFGDSSFKQGPGDQTNQRVIVVPDITRLTVKKGDMILLCCDGVFEGQFPTEDVVQFVAQECPPQHAEMALPAARVVDQAIRRGSKDNITCMCVHLGDGSETVEKLGRVGFVPGPPYPRTHETSRTCYSKMAQLAGLSTAEALELRYNLLQHFLEGTLDEQAPVMQVAFELSDDVDVETEKVFFGTGPAQNTPQAVQRYFDSLAEGPA